MSKKGGWENVIIEFSCIICTPNFWTEKSGKMVFLIHMTLWYEYWCLHS